MENYFQKMIDVLKSYLPLNERFQFVYRWVTMPLSSQTSEKRRIFICLIYAFFYWLNQHKWHNNIQAFLIDKKKQDLACVNLDFSNFISKWKKQQKKSNSRWVMYLNLTSIIRVWIIIIMKKYFDLLMNTNFIDILHASGAFFF